MICSSISVLCSRLCFGYGRYNIEPSLYSPYLSLGACMEGLNNLFTQLYGVSLMSEHTSAGEVWSEDVRKVVNTYEQSKMSGIVYVLCANKASLPLCVFPGCGT